MFLATLHVQCFASILLFLASPLCLQLWRRHKQHNRTERRAVEYCTVYLNQCWANGQNTCEYSVYAQCVLLGMPCSRTVALEGRLMDCHGLPLQGSPQASRSEA
jgi:hypothetical protein